MPHLKNHPSRCFAVRISKLSSFFSSVIDRIIYSHNVYLTSDIRGDCDHRDPGGDAVAGAEPGAGTGAQQQLCE